MKENERIWKEMKEKWKKKKENERKWKKMKAQGGPGRRREAVAAPERGALRGGAVSASEKEVLRGAVSASERGGRFGARNPPWVLGLGFRACARAKPEHPSAVRPRPLTTPRLWIDGGGVSCARAPDSLRSACINGMHGWIYHAPFIHEAVERGIISSPVRVPCRWWHVFGAARP